jgi:hypothetical protein
MGFGAQSISRLPASAFAPSKTREIRRHSAHAPPRAGGAEGQAAKRKTRAIVPRARRAIGRAANASSAPTGTSTTK